MSLTVIPEQDEAEAIDKSNILKAGRTRGAKPEGSYVEPSDEEGLPANDGTSATR
jgi:Histone chaperone domain CHZ